ARAGPGRAAAPGRRRVLPPAGLARLLPPGHGGVPGPRDQGLPARAGRRAGMDAGRARARRVAGRADRRPDRRRRDEAARRRGVHAQPGPHDHRLVPGQDPRHRLAAGVPALRRAARRRRRGQQRGQLAVGGGHREQPAARPGHEPAAPGGPVRPRRRLRAPLRPRARQPGRPVRPRAVAAARRAPRAAALPGAADRDGLSGLASRRPLAGHARGGSLVQPGKGCPTAACRALPTVARVGRVIFMCGPAGSGKSTVARQYERQGMTRLSVDQEAWARGVTAMPLPPAVRGDIERALRARLLDLVRAGSDVVLDLSFWSRGMRDEYRALLRPLGVVPETVYLATDRATVLRRVSARAARDGDDFRLSAELAARYFDHFEAPTAAEGPLTVIGGDG